MNCQEIKDYALLLSGLNDIPNGYVLKYINEIMNNLAVKYDSAGKKDFIDIIAIKGEWIQLPNNCITVKRCIEKESNLVCDEFLVENGYIQFMISKTYTTEYVALQNKVINITDTPSINLLYHEALAYGVAFKESTRIFAHEDMIQGNNKFLLFQEFNAKAAESNKKLMSIKHSRKRIKYADFI